MLVGARADSHGAKIKSIMNCHQCAPKRQILTTKLEADGLTKERGTCAGSDTLSTTAGSDGAQGRDGYRVTTRIYEGRLSKQAQRYSTPQGGGAIEGVRYCISQYC